MEQLISNLSLWGISAMIFTTSQLIWRIWRVRSAHKIRQIFRIILLRTDLFIKTEYKPLASLTVSILVILWMRNFTQSLLPVHYFFWIGALAVLIPVFLSYALDYFKNWMRVSEKFYNGWMLIFRVNTPVNIAAFLIILVLGGGMLQAYMPHIENNLAFVQIVGVLIAGFSMVAISIRLIQYFTKITIEPYNDSLISAERLDVLIASITASMITASVEHTSPGFIFLPLWFGAFVIFSSLLVKANIVPKKLKTFGMDYLLMLTLIVGAGFWLCGLFASGKYYQLTLISLLGGVFTGVLADSIINFYKFVQDRYTTFFIKKPVLHKALTYLIRSVITMLCMAVLTGGILYMYQLFSLYGLSLVVIGALANLTTKVSMDIPAKWGDKLETTKF